MTQNVVLPKVFSIGILAGHHKLSYKTREALHDSITTKNLLIKVPLRSSSTPFFFRRKGKDSLTKGQN